MTPDVMNENLPRSASFMLLLRVNFVQAWRKLVTVGSRSRSLTWIIVLFICSYPIIASWLFRMGLWKVSRAPGIGPMLIEELVFLLFAFLFTLLLFSNVVVGYSNLFRNQESQFLITLPLTSDTIYRWKFIESTIVASWAFLLLVSPLLVAYGIHHGASWHFYILTPMIVGLFIMLPAVFGCWIAIVLARYLDRRRLVTLVFPVLITVIIGLYVYMQPQLVSDESLVTQVSDERTRLLDKARFAQYPLMPSYWLSKSVIEWKDGVFSLAFFYMMVMLSNVLFFGCLAFTRTGRFFYSAMSETLSRGSIISNMRSHLRFTGQACAGLMACSFFLPYLSTTPVMYEAQQKMKILRIDVEEKLRTHQWNQVTNNSEEAKVVEDRIEKIIVDLSQQLGPENLGGFAVPLEKYDVVRPRFREMPELVAEIRGFVDAEALEAEFSLQLSKTMHQNISGTDLAFGYTALRSTSESVEGHVQQINATSILFAIPIFALIAGLSQRRVLFGIAGLLPFVVVVFSSHPVWFPPLNMIGLGGWLTMFASLGLMAAALGWWDQIKISDDKYRYGFLDRVVGCIPGLASDTRALLLKDIRVFWRDTAQWSQSLVLFGLLGVYIMNIRYFTNETTPTYWLYVVSYMNLAACALNLATLTTRFVYPQFSLEGKRLWIVGLAPMGLARVVRIKLGLAIAVSLVISLPLVWLSGYMLNQSFAEIIYFSFGILIMAFTLNALAIGMGVLYPNLKVDNPSKIVSGFGGTFCLVISFVYIGGSVMFLGQASPWGSPWHLFGPPSDFAIAVAAIAFLALSIGLGVVPLAQAKQKLARFEQ